MLLFSPTALFLLPGALCVLARLFPLVALGGGPKVLFGLTFDVHYMVLGSLLTILGFQVMVTGLFAKAYSHASRLFAPDRTLTLIGRYFNLERGSSSVPSLLPRFRHRRLHSASLARQRPGHASTPCAPRSRPRP